MKPYAVSVTIGQTVTGKEFDTEIELKGFLTKAEELKKKAPTLLVKVIRNGLPKKSTPVKSTAILDDRKEDSIGWERITMSDGPFVIGGKQQYRSIPTPHKKGNFYCPYCCGYKPVKQKVNLGFGLELEGCTDCGATMNDFHVKRTNIWMKG